MLKIQFKDTREVMKSSLLSDEIEKKYKLLEEENRQLKEKFKALELYCKKLEYQINQLTRQRFGKKSEKRVLSPKVPSSEQKNLNGRKPLPESLEREIIEYKLPEDLKKCNVCKHALVRIGEELSEQLHYVQPYFRVKKHVQEKYGCAHCGETLFIAEKPEQPIAKGLATSELLSHILVSKYQDHQPLHRQEQIFARQGIDLARSTLCDWVKGCAKLAEIVVNVMKKDLLTRGRVHSDDTPVSVQVSGKKGKMHQGRLWVYIGCEEEKPTIVLYDYTQTRNQEGPFNFLSDYEGFLQVDAYAGVRHEVAKKSCFTFSKKIKPLVLPSEPRGLNKEQLRQCSKVLKARDTNSDRSIFLVAKTE